MKLKQNEIVTVCGMPGMGKTELVKYELKRANYPFLIYDVNDEYTEFLQNRYVPEGESVEEFSKVCLKVWEHGNILFVVDEAEQFFPEGKPFVAGAFQIVRRHKHQNIGLIAITRTLGELKKTVLKHSSKVIIFKYFITPADVEYRRLKPLIHEYVDELPTMPDYHFFIYERGECKRYKPIKL